MRRIRIFFILALLFILSAIPSMYVSSETGRFSPTIIARIEHGPVPHLMPNQVISILDYGGFTWAELTAQQTFQLQQAGVSFTLQPSATRINVPNFSFDTSMGEPEIPVEMRATESGPAFRLVQLAGPTRDAWLAQLETAGLRVLQYYPHYSYLVWATQRQVEEASAYPFVRWNGAFHPAYKIDASLVEENGTIENVDIVLFNDGDIPTTLKAITQLGGKLVQYYPSQPDKSFYDAIVEINAGSLPAVARLNTVLWIGYSHPEPVLDDEMSSQIVAGNYLSGVPYTGYRDWLDATGYDGSGVRWAIVDTGVDYDHPDLGPRIVGGYSFPGTCSPEGSDCAGGGHGTHVAGIAGGDASAGYADNAGFLYGMGIAPGVEIFAMNSASGYLWPPTGGWQEHSKRAILGGAVGANNSWYTGEPFPHGYQSSERIHDIMVRDGNFDTPDVAEPLIEVFSAGNKGPGLQTLTPPKEAKNLIVVASTQNYRSGDIDAISHTSSRGPALDGRWLPTVAAPGDQIASARNDLGGTCTGSAKDIPGTDTLYSYCSGTSMAAPHVSGALAVITQWWRGFNAGSDPSPAMAKALLVNGAIDMDSPDIPNAHEGWGRVHLPNVIDNEAIMIYLDQSHIFQDTGESWSLAVTPADSEKPLKVTLAWSDAPGAVGANPALVNDLDLEVEIGGETFRGNVFTDGWSATDGGADSLNNLENVFLQHPEGWATITVRAVNISGDGVPYNGDATDQDFALVCQNCATGPDFTLQVAPQARTICAPEEAVFSLELGQVLDFQDPVTLTAEGIPTGTQALFDLNPIVPPATSTLTITHTGAAAPGSYSIDIGGVAPSSTHTATVSMDLFTAAPGQVSLISPADGAPNLDPTPTMVWTATHQTTNYYLEIARDEAFANVVYSATVENTNHTLESELNTIAVYYWRVRGSNACGNGPFSPVYSFSTIALPGDCPLGTEPQILFSEGFETGAPGWSSGGLASTWEVVATHAHGGTWSYYAVDSPSVSDQQLTSPLIPLPTDTVSLTLQYWDRQSIEDSFTGCFDGGILEVSTDGGTGWTQLDVELLTHGYDGLVRQDTGNPLGGRMAWCGESPEWVLSVVDLSAFAGETVRFRYRLGTDSYWGEEGWYLDDLMVQSCHYPAPEPEIDLVKTVGTNPEECAITQEVTLPFWGGQVTYCYQVTNTGEITLTLHDLVDSHLGVILEGYPTNLAPEDSFWITQTVSISLTTANTATWEAYNPGPADWTLSTDSAVVHVALPTRIYLPVALMTAAP